MEKCKLIAHLLKDRVKSQILELQNNREVEHLHLSSQMHLKKSQNGHILGSCSASALLFHPAWVLGANSPILQMLAAKIRLYGWLERHLLGFICVCL